MHSPVVQLLRGDFEEEGTPSAAFSYKQSVGQSRDTLPRSEGIFCGVWGPFHARFGGPGEGIPIAAAQAFVCVLNPSGSIVVRFATKHNCFFARVVSRAAPTFPIPGITKEQL